MRLERLTTNKIKIFLSSDDLFERGLIKDDIWKESTKWHQLFHDLLEEACEEFDVDIQGSVAVEVFSLHAQGMILILTMEENESDEEILFDGFIEMQVILDESEEYIYEFEDFEDIIQLAPRLSANGINGGSLVNMKGRYYFILTDTELAHPIRVGSILSEYGNASIISQHVLLEYGKIIMKDNAVATLLRHFK